MAKSPFLTNKSTEFIRLIDERNNTAARLGKVTDTSYSHVVNKIEELTELGYIEKNKKDRRKVLTLTEKGQKAQELIKELLSL